MRYPVFIVLCFIFTNAFPGEPSDSIKSKFSANCTVSFNSNGIAAIPAFSLGKPALVASAGLAKGRLSYDPTLAYGLDMRPWYIDSWIHLKIIERPGFVLRTGINFSNFFTEYLPPENIVLPDKITQTQRYWAIELAAIRYFNPNTSLTFMYWNDRGQDPGTLIGHYITLIGDKSNIRIGKSLLFSANIQFFYIDYTGLNDGLFISPKVALSPKSVPLSLFFQANQAISSNIEPFPGFQWNIGLAYSL